MEANLANEMLQMKSLDKALRYLETKGFQLRLMDVIAQDEFSHDVILPFPESHRFLAIGVT